MTTTTSPKANSARNWLKWFDVRHRASGTWAFALNRLTAIGITFYLFLHLIVLGTLARGEGAYSDFLALVKSPIFIFGEFLLVVGCLYHGLNGLRLALTGLGIAVPYQKKLFVILLVIAVIGSVVFGVRMFSV